MYRGSGCDRIRATKSLMRTTINACKSHQKDNPRVACVKECPFKLICFPKKDKKVKK